MILLAKRAVSFNFYQCYLIALFLFLFLLLSFSPPMALFFAVILLLVPINSDLDIYKAHLLILQFVIFISINIATLSEPILLFQESDFTSYYNNYLLFLNYGFSFEHFEWGGGLEVGLPLTNFVLSLIINEPMPYVVKLFYSSGQLLLLFIFLQLLRSRLNLSLRQYALLMAFVVIFYKFGALQNHLRQGFSTLFVLIALSSTSKKWRNFCFVFALMFHLSAIIIYPLISFFLNDQNVIAKKRFIKICLIFSGVLFASMPFLSTLVDVVAGPILGKVVWTLLRFSNEDFVLDSVKATVVRVVFFLPLIFMLVGVRTERLINIRLSLLSILVFALSFSYLPGFTIRLLSPVFLIYLGVFYYQVISLRCSLLTSKFLMVFLWCLMNINWVFGAVFYYYEFPLGDVKPFYYLADFMRESHFVNRQHLPIFDNVF